MSVPTKSAWFAECTSTRACSSHRRKRLNRCGHLHRTREAASRCANLLQRLETKPRQWRPVAVVWFLFTKAT
jgi:hypothetical protein